MASSSSCDMPSTASDEISKALIESALVSFQAAREKYRGGAPGPYILEGKYSIAAFEALVSKETHWKLSFADNTITLFGDPNDIHEEVSALVSDNFRAVDWDSHPDAPAALTGYVGRRKLLSVMQSSTRQWKLTPTSSSPYFKEADALFVSLTAQRKENGVAIEIAHLNESFKELGREIVDWTSGEGERVLLAVGVKIFSKPPFHRDPELKLIFRDSTPSTPSTESYTLDFGYGSRVAPQSCPRSGPPTPVQLAPNQPASGPRVLVPVDPTSTDLILELPVGAALFSELRSDTFTEELGLTLSDAYVQDLRTKRWALDLGFIRCAIMAIIRINDSSS